MKKSVSLILCIVLCLSALGVSAAAESTLPYPDSRFYECGDYNIHYRIVPHEGEFKGRIAMLHGFVCSTYAWCNMAAGLSAEGYDCVLIDLPNFGYSTREGADTEVIDREALVTGLMETIAPMEEWILAGHSMGGGVAINIAEEHPVRALLLYCPAPQSTAPDFLCPVLTSKFMTALMNTFFDVGLRATPLVRAVIYAATFDLEFSRSYDTAGVTAPLRYGDFGTGMCNMLFNVRVTDIADADKITAPVLLVQAQKDIILNSSMKKSINSAFPGAVHYLVEGGGHQCIENRAGELVSLTVDFLKAP